MPHSWSRLQVSESRSFRPSRYYEAFYFLDGDPSLPEFEMTHPLNTTVTEGQSATFHCRVRSIDKPIIQWIKVIDDPTHLEFNQSVEVRGLHITVLDKKYPTEVEDFRNATWLKRLTIPTVAAQDAGWYVCVVTSQKGHLFHRFAYLQVMPGKRFWSKHSDSRVHSDGKPFQFTSKCPSATKCRCISSLVYPWPSSCC